jgi:quercetin dioxygenase-like cupin family protein
MNAESIDAVQTVLPCTDLQATLDFFCDRLGFRVVEIFPADDPEVAVIAGHGTRLRIQRGDAAPPGELVVTCRDLAALRDGATTLAAPNGTRITLIAADPPVVLPELRESFVLNRADGGSPWIAGRAGLRYRDLIPDRLGGRFIASQIALPRGGPVGDYVHFHQLRFQMIYCRSGWVKVVYQDQGAPFVMKEGDCVLQPPGIRHRVLEASPGMDVVELACPALHRTLSDPTMTLPNPTQDPQLRYGGQRFVRHVAETATWQPWRSPGFEARDLGIAAATDGLADVRVVRRRGILAPAPLPHPGELQFYFILRGNAILHLNNNNERVASGDALVIPTTMSQFWVDSSDDAEFLEVRLPA